MDEKCHGHRLDLLNMEGTEAIKKIKGCDYLCQSTALSLSGISGLPISEENFLVFSCKTVYRKAPFALPLDTDMSKEQQKEKQVVVWQWAGGRVPIPVCLLKILA